MSHHLAQLMFSLSTFDPSREVSQQTPQQVTCGGRALSVMAAAFACLLEPLVKACSLRAKKAEDAMQQLQSEAEQAKQRAASAEVKMEVLQRAVQQAEERVASLEMQVSTQ